MAPRCRRLFWGYMLATIHCLIKTYLPTLISNLATTLTQIYLSSSPVGRLDGSHPGAEVEVSGRQLRQRHVVLLGPELVDPAFGQRDPHGHVLARNLAPGLGVRVGDHHVRAYFNLLTNL